MPSYSQEYVAALVVVIVSALKAFGVEVASDVVTAIVTGLLAVWIMIRRFQKKDISVLGKRI